MKISGFSFVRNGISLGYPVTESIRSILPICDEFFITVGKGDDNTLEQIQAISDPKINIIETVWDETMFVRGAINAYQTNIALKECSGDWCFYVQADEVVHEKYLPIVREKCEKYLNENDVQGLLFNYRHFWGSFDKIQVSRNWYRAEVRVVRNNISVESFQSAQGFRVNGEKLKVARSDAYIYHYGWVRPPYTMRKKKIALDTLHHDKNWVEAHNPAPEQPFDYGNLKNLADFNETHPKVMAEFIKRTTSEIPINPDSTAQHDHDKFWVRLLSWIERKILHFRIGEWKNYILIR
jgi:glycosyltransferase involved in cell wall biosynthesis